MISLINNMKFISSHSREWCRWAKSSNFVALSFKIRTTQRCIIQRDFAFAMGYPRSVIPCHCVNIFFWMWAKHWCTHWFADNHDYRDLSMADALLFWRYQFARVIIPRNLGRVVWLTAWSLALLNRSFSWRVVQVLRSGLPQRPDQSFQLTYQLENYCS